MTDSPAVVSRREGRRASWVALAGLGWSDLGERGIRYYYGYLISTRYSRQLPPADPPSPAISDEASSSRSCADDFAAASAGTSGLD